MATTQALRRHESCLNHDAALACHCLQFGEELGFARDWNVPDPQSVEVWPECPGDLQGGSPVLHGLPAASELASFGRCPVGSPRAAR